jgi:6-pyruvoyl-tetrahydropterin synthase
VEIQLTGEALDEHGFIVDYNVMDQRIGEWIASVLDHRDLNTDVPNIGQPTAENLAEFIWSMVDEKFRDVEICVRVAETPKTWAQYPGW